MREIDINRDLGSLVDEEFVGLHSGGGRSSIVGGQSAADSALVANPDLPVVFIFNEAALQKLQLSSKRIYFYLETLQDLAGRRDLSVFIGDPYEYGSSNDVAVTYAPVPSFAKFKNLAEVHPYPWLVKPHQYSVRSFSSWRNKISPVR